MPSLEEINFLLLGSSCVQRCFLCQLSSSRFNLNPRDGCAEELIREQKRRFQEAFLHVMPEEKRNLRVFCFGVETEENLLEFLWIGDERRLDGLCAVVMLPLTSKFSRGLQILRSMLISINKHRMLITGSDFLLLHNDCQLGRRNHRHLFWS
jgi:hypothetical protein